ncbi:MAG: hypothetical protein IJP17_03200, partial [Clostridia bacterium]|nr:hypothetical protein [Clostridia bacterium]
MKTSFKKIVLVTLCTLMLLLLCSCDSGIINTELSLDRSFSGTRTMSFEIKQSDLNSWDVTGVLSSLLSTPTTDDIVKVLEKDCPDELTMKTSKNGNDATCTFTLIFSSKEEYERKVAALLGSAPVVNYAEPSEDLFTSGFTLSENFTSSDLFGWAQDALREAYPKYADKISLSEQSGKTVVIYDGVSRPAENKINLSPVFTPLSSVTVTTVRYGDNDYSRVIEIGISAENLASIGKENFEKSFLAPLTSGIDGVVKTGWNEDGTTYSICLEQGSLDDLSSVTAAIMPGSTAEYNSAAESGPFTESGILNEHFSFGGFVCNKDGSANVKLVYKAGDDTTFTKDEQAKLEDGGKTLIYTVKNATEKDVSVVSETRYAVTSMSVVTELGFTGNYTVSVSLGFPAESSRSASERAAAYLTQAYKDCGLKVETIKSDYVGEGMDESIPNYALLIIAEGTPEKITSAFSKAFGGANSLIVSNNGALELYKKNDITHSVDLTALAEMAAYEGPVTYGFNSTMTKLQEVNWTDSKGGENPDVLSGTTRKNTFSASDIGAASFVINYQCSSINITAIIALCLIGVVALGLIMVVSNFFGRKLRGKKTAKKQEQAVEAVKAVALANIPEDKRGELAELPAELTMRPTVVIEPKTDDGLNEDDDEPEGVLMFATTLRILILSVIA